MYSNFVWFFLNILGLLCSAAIGFLNGFAKGGSFALHFLLRIEFFVFTK